MAWVGCLVTLVPRVSISGWEGRGIAWRGGAETEVGQVMAAMVGRLRSADAGLDFLLAGDSLETLFRRAILENRRVTNAQLTAISQVTLEQLATPPEQRAVVLRRVPEARKLRVHRFTVALLAAATGVEAAQLSELAPDLGLTGSPDTPFLWAARSERAQHATALHDFTDYLRATGLTGLNEAVWGVEGREWSALASWLGWGPEASRPP
ncbi:hypothetical protein [Stigmatella aurantiaca]|uniref:Uncharacterized protein n=1 Tax=Stigmatella aurantiaca (strain DW4/3-1) TaxID=378806 RepID=E3FKR8_STIAD|nr:hypothetical protein [Stigmatella aurantiaca]ADO69236.1 uncharacterized protein STAUR_1432 [Stigmatella aurantiaca DW4/3-1]